MIFEELYMGEGWPKNDHWISGEHISAQANLYNFQSSLNNNDLNNNLLVRIEMFYWRYSHIC